ncbi:hypothetical protein [Foetidibacter luteolus]|uniref:hypothetical protein n=1 Tax=Foetidibacter luteolus TaxID=2608880 RepID=UPI00129BCE66|nr:hypothetical protein [Foetidibacter luteolus]
MKNRIRLTICMLCFSVFCQGQVTMTLQVPPAGVLMKNQLWNMLLVSAIEGEQLVTVTLNLQDVQTNQVLLTGISRTITLRKGAAQLQVADVSPIQYSYFSPAFNNDRDPNGMLPAGNYLACYSLTGSHHAVLAENCISVNVEPLSPPLLSTPAHEAVLQTAWPQFSWLPPTPPNLFGDLSYDLTLVEVLPGQSSSEAVQVNVPVFGAGRLRELLLNYPASSKQLDTGKVYAWRITGRNNGNAIAFSDIWTFTVQQPNAPTPSPKIISYMALKRPGEPAGDYLVETGTINIRFYSFDSEYMAEVRFKDASGKVIRSQPQKILYGDNFLGFKAGSDFSKGQLYTVEMKDKAGKIYQASFSVK